MERQRRRRADRETEGEEKKEEEEEEKEEEGQERGAYLFECLIKHHPALLPVCVHRTAVSPRQTLVNLATVETCSRDSKAESQADREQQGRRARQRRASHV